MHFTDDSRPGGSTRGFGSPGRPPGILPWSGPRVGLVFGALLATLGAASPGLRTLVSGEIEATSEAALPVLDEETVAELPVEINERVRYWVERFTTDERRTFEEYMSREGLYGDLIRAKLAERGMPGELIYLAMIESGFSPAATSHVAAVGLWQFMGPTAQQYGLRVDDWVDERRDPIRATDAALEYLTWLHDRYDSWYLAAAAYNAGHGRVDRALRRQGARSAEGDADLYWEIIDDLPRETREHVPRMLAFTLLARDTDRYAFDIQPAGAYTFDRVWVPGGTPLRIVARALDVPTSRLRELNPHLVRGTTPPGGSYGLRVPVGDVAQVVASIGGGPWGAGRADD